MNKKTLRIAGWALGLSMAVAGIGAAAGASFATANEPTMVSAVGTSDTIDNSATSSNLSNTATSSWATNFSITGASGATYYIHSMGTKNTSNALQWNSNGFLYATGAATDGAKLKSVTITTTANKNIGVYASNTAYSAAPSGTALSTLAATSSGAKYTFTSDYSYIALKGAASSTSITSIVIEYKEVAPTVTLNESSLTGFKTDSDNTISATFENFNASTTCSVMYKDNDAEEYTSTPGVATVTPTYNSTTGKYDLDVSYDAVGTTTAKITVSGGGQSADVALSITVNAKPATLTVSGNGIVNGTPKTLEIENGASKSFTKNHITVQDTDGDDYEISSISDVTLSNVDGDDCVTISGGKITGKSVGTCTVRVALNALITVYDEIEVSVIDDYNAEVTSVTFNDSLADTQGETLDISEIVSASVTSTHFGSTSSIADDEFLFSYNTGDRENAVEASDFVYDFFDDEKDVGETEDQTIYVYTTFDEDYEGHFDITITKADNPITAITLTNAEISNDEVTLNRNTTLQLAVSFTPANTTDSRALTYAIDEANSDDGHSVTVSSTGLISAGSVIGKSAVVTVTSVAQPSVSAELIVNVARETQTINIDEPLSESLTKITSTGDLTDGQYLIVAESATVALCEAVNSTSNAASYTSLSTVTKTLKGYLFTYDSTDGSLCGPNGSYIGKTATGNGMDVSADPLENTITFSENNVLITGEGGSVLKYNSSWGGFRYYGSGQTSLQLYKYSSSGGASVKTVEDDLYNAVVSANAAFTCQSSGTGSDLSNWKTTVASYFTSAIVTKYKLEYAVANEDGNEVEKFLSVYDYIVTSTKYGDSYDFLGRIDSGKAVANSSNNFFGTEGSDNNNAAILIAAICTISVVTFAGFAFLRRKKEDR